jgi:hypothetical protein
MGPEDQHRPDDRWRQGLAGPGRVAPDKADLKFPKAILRDSPVLQLPKAGIHAVDDLAAGHPFQQGLTATLQEAPAFVGQDGPVPTLQEVEQAGECHPVFTKAEHHWGYPGSTIDRSAWQRS